jgi:hypothetical protein
MASTARALIIEKTGRLLPTETVEIVLTWLVSDFAAQSFTYRKIVRSLDEAIREAKRAAGSGFALYLKGSTLRLRNRTVRTLQFRKSLQPEKGLSVLKRRIVESASDAFYE